MKKGSEPNFKSKMEPRRSDLEKKLGVTFKKKALLDEALTHRSYLNEQPSSHSHNERLEFLGDAVIELVVTEYLFKKFPAKPEGELTSIRAALVRKETLSEVAGLFQLTDYLKLSQGEKRNLAKSKMGLAADAFEAIIGALYLDQGLIKSKNFLSKHLIPIIEAILEEKRHVDPKSHLQELSQAKWGITPSYRVLQEWGPDHAKHFRVGVYLEEKELGSGEGSSKQEAEQAAAKAALGVVESRAKGQMV